MVVRGEVDAHSADGFSAFVITAIAGSPHLVIDMQGVAFFDLSGLGVIADTLRKLTPSDRSPSATPRNRRHAPSRWLAWTSWSPGNGRPRRSGTSARRRALPTNALAGLFARYYGSPV